MREVIRKWGFFWIVIPLLISCSLPFFTETVPSTPTRDFFSAAATASMKLTLTAGAQLDGAGRATVTPGGPTEVFACAYRWARKSLTEESAQVQSVFDRAGYSNVDVKLEGYGEECVNPATNQVVRFLTLQTDFRLKITVNSLVNENTLGNMLANYLILLKDFPPEDLPGTQPGNIGVVFTTGKGELNLWFPYVRGMEAVDQGLRGAALINYLR